MYFVESNHRPNGKKIRRAMSSAMNLLLIASFITGPASIVLLPTLSLAAPLPFPPEWMLPILASLKTGKLTPADIGTLKKYGTDSDNKLSYKKLISIIERIDAFADQQKSPYRIDVSGFYISNDPPTVRITVTVTDQKTLKEVEYKLGNAKYDVGPMKKTSLHDFMVDVTE